MTTRSRGGFRTPILQRLCRGFLLACCLWPGGFAAAQTAAPTALQTTAPPPPVATASPLENASLESLLPNGRQPRPGLLVGGQPSEEQLAALRKAGVQTLIDLRTPSEPGATDPAAAERLGFKFVRIPIGGLQDLTRENAAALRNALEEDSRQVDPDGRKRPVALTCGSGNRVGALLALSAHWLDGMPAQEALDLGLRAGLTRLEPTVRSLLGIPSH